MSIGHSLSFSRLIDSNTKGINLATNTGRAKAQELIDNMERGKKERLISNVPFITNKEHRP